MKALVIGGNRFFGKNLVALLLERGTDVTLLNRGQIHDEFGSRVKRIILDRKTLHKDHPALRDEKWDIVYDQVCFDSHEAQSACESFHGKTRRYIFTSSQSVYKPGRSISESAFDPRTYSFHNFIDRNQDYSEAKRQAESVFFQKASFPITAVRFPIVLGDNDYTGRLELYVKRIAENRPLYFPNIEAQISFIHSDDAAQFLNFLLDHEISGPINCCADEPISLHSLIKEIESATLKNVCLDDDIKNNASPYGIESDWFMNTQNLKKLGFTANPIRQWLPALIQQLANKISVEQTQIKIFAKMTFAQKWEEVCKLRELAWTLKSAGVRAQHPDWSEQHIHSEVRRIFLNATT